MDGVGGECEGAATGSEEAGVCARLCPRAAVCSGCVLHMLHTRALPGFRVLQRKQVHRAGDCAMRTAGCDGDGAENVDSGIDVCVGSVTLGFGMPMCPCPSFLREETEAPSVEKDT